MGRDSFSPREQQVIDLLLAGGSNASIAYDLQIQLRTVKKYIDTIACRLDIPTETYSTRVRICYVLLHRQGKLPDWPRP